MAYQLLCTLLLDQKNAQGQLSSSWSNRLLLEEEALRLQLCINQHLD